MVMGKGIKTFHRIKTMHGAPLTIEGKVKIKFEIEENNQ